MSLSCPTVKKKITPAMVRVGHLHAMQRSWLWRRLEVEGIGLRGAEILRH